MTETKRALDEPEFVPADLVGDLLRHTRQRIAAEEALLTQLEGVDVVAPAEWEDVLRIVAALRALDSEFAAHCQQAILSQHGDALLPAAALVEQPCRWDCYAKKLKKSGPGHRRGRHPALAGLCSVDG